LFASMGKDWPYWAGTVVMVIVGVLAWRSMASNVQAKKDALSNYEN